MDTVIIKIFGPNKFRVSNFSQFLPEFVKRDFKDLSPTERSSTHHYLKRFVLHPKWQEEYLPRIEIFETLTKDRKNIRHILKIEFSVPKLLYWNSLQEVSEKDAQKVFSSLKSALERVNILVSTDMIENAMVSAIHVCKNIPLPKTVRMREVINELAKMNMGKAFDISDKQHKKGARVLNIHSGTIDWSFYDKVSDSQRPKNKRNDKGRINRERAIIEFYNLQEREIFRYEYRVKKAQTVKRDVNVILARKHDTKVVFKDLFEKNLLKTLLLKSWDKLTSRPENQLVLFGTPDKLGLLLHLLFETKNQNKKAHSINNALISYGLATGIRDHGAKEVLGSIFDVSNKDHPERIMKKIKLAAKLTEELPFSNNFAFIDTELKKFELITLESLEKGI